MLRIAGAPRCRTRLWAALSVAALASLAAADVALPPPPERYFNDHANFVAEDVARRLDETLRRFDEETSSQVVVAVFPKLPAPSLEDFTARTAQAWRVGRKDMDNGAVLFVFAQDRKLRLEVGYGLEDRIPDAVAKRIIEDVMVPRFRSGDAGGGLSAGIDAILAAARGQEAPAAEAVPRRSSGRRDPPLLELVGFAIFLLLAWILDRVPRSATYSRRGRQQASRLSGGGCLSLMGVLGGLGGFLLLSNLTSGAGSLVLAVVLLLVIVALVLWAANRGGGSGWGGWSSGGWGGGGWSGGGWSGGGSGGGFSGGGGSFGGGGASGSW